jgi:hypothetical protein
MMIANNLPIGSFSEITAGMQSGGNTLTPSSNSTSQTL